MLLFFLAIRLCFYVQYKDELLVDFRMDISSWLWVLIGCLRFDMIIVLWMAILLYGGLMMADLLFHSRLAIRNTLRSIVINGYVLASVSMIMLSIIDIKAYKISGRRLIGQDLLVAWQHISMTDEVVGAYLLLLALLIAVVVGYLYIVRRLYKKYCSNVVDQIVNRSANAFVLVLSFVLMFIVWLGLIGLFSGNKISPLSAAQYIAGKDISLVTNTPFHLLYSIYKPKPELLRKKYYSDPELAQLYPVHNVCNGLSSINDTQPNILIFMMESVSGEYVNDPITRKRYMPFIDSLMQHSLVYDRAYANGLTSVMGFNAIVGGIPAWMPIEFPISYYAHNRYKGLGSYMQEMGYTTWFYNGGNDQGFGFEKSANLYGITNYYDMNDYPIAEHFDSAYGIYDHYFLPWAANKLTAINGPFLSVIFNVSTHFPFKQLPADFYIPTTDLQGELDAGNALRYYDESLRMTFEVLKQSSNYEHTIFLFVADHFSRSTKLKNQSALGIYEIPFFIYSPTLKLNQYEKCSDYIAEQIDILPTVLGLVGYKGNCFSFGKNIIDTIREDNAHNGYAMQNFGTVYQLTDGEYFLRYDGVMDSTIALYNQVTDPELKANIAELEPIKKTELELQLRARIQQFNNSMIDNKMH